MAYTPAFQKILDRVQEMSTNQESLEAIRKFFSESVQSIGMKERLNNLYRIRPKKPKPGEKSSFQFFRMNQMQEKFFDNHTTRDLVLKMRQGGVTTLSCLIALDMCLWQSGTNTAIIADVKDKVKKFFRIAKNAYICFKKDWGELYPITSTTDNVNELSFNETGSTLTVCTDAKGLTLNFLHFSEAAFIEKSRITESIDSVPLSCWIIMETTADTTSGLFYDLWEMGEKGKITSYKNHFFPWFDHYPEEEDLPRLKPPASFKPDDEEIVLKKTYNLTDEHLVWRRIKLAEYAGDKGEFNRMHPTDALTCFLGGEHSVFSYDVLAGLIKHEREPAYMGDLVLS